MPADLNQLIAIPKAINPGLAGTGNALARALLGNPRASYGQDCRPVTDPALKRRMITASVGPFRVTGYDLAVQSLTSVMADIRRQQPRAYDALGSAGMLCCRHVRGSGSAISNHSWGCAVDLTLNGRLDRRGNNRVQRGLALIAPIFNRHGWYWGADFRTEDAMHFEVSRQLMLRWNRDGLLSTAGPIAIDTTPTLQQGDRGPAVVALQQRLNAAGMTLDIDGVFGPQTKAAVAAFQSARGHNPSGIVDDRVWSELAAASPSPAEPPSRFSPHQPHRQTEHWRNLHGGISTGQFEIPRKGLANGTLQRTLNIAREPHGELAHRDDLAFVKGRCSMFGGATDAVNRGQAMTLTGLTNEDYSEFEFFCAMRWDYRGRKNFWRERPILVMNPGNGRCVICEAVDWGPGLSYRGKPIERIIDLSRGAMTSLGVTTDDDVLVAFADQSAWIRLTGGATGPVLPQFGHED